MSFADFFQVNPTATAKITAAGRNALVTSLIICCGFVACWSLNALLFFLNFVRYSVDFGGWLYHFSVVLVFTNSCINPFFLRLFVCLFLSFLLPSFRPSCSYSFFYFFSSLSCFCCLMLLLLSSSSSSLFFFFCINPFIYAAKYGEFQQGFRRLMLKVKPDQHQPQDGAIALDRL